MSLKPFQILIQPGVLYRVRGQNLNNLNRSLGIHTQLRPTIESFGGSAVDVHGSQIFSDNPPTGMPKIFTALVGISPFNFIPNYLYIAAGMTPPDAIVLSGVAAAAELYITANVEIETFVNADLALMQHIEANIDIITFVGADLTLT